MSVTIRLERSAAALAPNSWQLLPMRFHRPDEDSVVLTNLVGEHVFVTPDELISVTDKTCTDQGLLARLRAAHLIQVPGEALAHFIDVAEELKTQLPGSNFLRKVFTGGTDLATHAGEMPIRAV